MSASEPQWPEQKSATRSSDTLILGTAADRGGCCNCRRSSEGRAGRSQAPSHIARPKDNQNASPKAGLRLPALGPSNTPIAVTGRSRGRALRVCVRQQRAVRPSNGPLSSPCQHESAIRSRSSHCCCGVPPGSAVLSLNPLSVPHEASVVDAASRARRTRGEPTWPESNRTRKPRRSRASR